MNYYVIRVNNELFLTEDGYSREYPDAKKFRSYQFAMHLIESRNVLRYGNVELIQNYGLENEYVEDI